MATGSFDIMKSLGVHLAKSSFGAARTWEQLPVFFNTRFAKLLSSWVGHSAACASDRGPSSTECHERLSRLRRCDLGDVSSC